MHFIYIFIPLLIIILIITYITYSKSKHLITASIFGLISMWFSFNLANTFWKEGNYEFHIKETNEVIVANEVSQDFWGKHWHIKDTTNQNVIRIISKNNIGEIVISND